VRHKIENVSYTGNMKKTNLFSLDEHLCAMDKNEPERGIADDSRY